MPRPRKVSNEQLLATLMETEPEVPSECLGEKLGVSRPTVNRRLQEMHDGGWITVTPFRDEYGHRRYTIQVLAKGRKKLESWQKRVSE